MRRYLLAIVLVALAAAVIPAAAQQAITLETVQVQFWPEYDLAEMLVIIDIVLPEDVELPVDVSVIIPAAAGEPNAVAVNLNDNLVTTAYTREVVGDWAEIVITADSSVVHVEYYDPSLDVSSSTRTFSYSWMGRYAVDQMIVIALEPVGASSMTFSQDMGAAQTGSDGINYFSRDFGALESGEQFDFSISYQKSNNTLTVDALSAESAADTASAFSTQPWWMWLLVGLGAVLIVMGAWFFINDASKNGAKGKSKYAQKHRAASRPSKAGGKPARFCHNCGSATQPGDKFCRECGQKLRV